MKFKQFGHNFRFALAWFAAFLATSATGTANTILFTEDFSAGLSAWTGKSGGSHQGVVVADPFNPANPVLSFSGLNVSGDIFTSALLSVGSREQTFISFEYLGLSMSGSNPGNLGGFVGVSIDLLPEGGDAAWIAGTDPSAANGLGFTGIKLIDDGRWNSYEINITSILAENDISSIHLMLEDWRDAGGVAGDVFFDNVQVRSVSVPETSATSFLLGIATLLLFVTKRKIGQHNCPSYSLKAPSRH